MQNIEKLKSLLADVFELKESEITENLTKDYVSNWDSLTQMDLVSSLEREFEVEFEMLEIVQLISIKNIIDILKLKGIEFER